MQEVKAKIDSKAQTAEKEVRTQLETVKKRIEQDRTKLETAQADVKKWVDDFKAPSNDICRQQVVQPASRRRGDRGGNGEP
jgi:nitric oxide reductase activation protein